MINLKSALAVGLCLLGGTTGQALAAPTQTLQYELYAGGLHALGAQIRLEEEASRYKVDMTSKTASGFRLVAPWTGSFVTTGWLDKGQRHPQTYDTVSKKGSKTKTKSISYSRNGELVSYRQTENGTDKTPDPLDRTLAPKGIVDILTATLQIGDRLAAGKGCAGSATIFDGDRNFKLTFKDAGAQTLPANKYSSFQGAAEACTFTMAPGEGNWNNKRKGWLMLQDQAHKLGSEPTVYFAKIDPQGGYVPVRVQIKTNYGTLLLHLAKSSAEAVKNTN